MNSSMLSIIIGGATSIIVGLALLIIEYRTAFFARWSQKRISDTQPDAEELRRQEVYVQRCVELINNAEDQVVIRTSKMSRTSEMRESVELRGAIPVNQAIRNARKKHVNVRILVAANYDRLPGALELSEACDAAVRFDPEIPISDINYYCADSSHVIIATRQPSPESQHRRSTSWIEFRSTFLASVLSNEFNRHWRSISTRRLEEYMTEVLPVAIREQGINTVAIQLGKESNHLERYTQLKPFILFIIGRPGSGKTTIAQLIKQNLPSTGVYLRITHISDLEYLRRVFSSVDDTEKRFKKTDDGGFFILDPALFDEALVDLSAKVLRDKAKYDLLIVEFARQYYIHALDVMRSQGVQPNLVVYIDVDFKTALERNKLRSIRSNGDGHFVSEQEMGATYAKDDVEELMKLDPPKTMIIDNNRDVLSGLDESVYSIIREVKDATK